MDGKRYVMAVGSDDAGVNLKNFIRDQLGDDERVEEVIDFGVADADDKTAYPVVCIRAAEAVARGEADRAVLFGGTGLGEAISANKVRGIRAVVAHDPYSIERSILSNNCQVLCLGERVIAPELADRIVKQWLGYEFDASSPSAAKVQVHNRLRRERQPLERFATRAVSDRALLGSFRETPCARQRRTAGRFFVEDVEHLAGRVLVRDQDVQQTGARRADVGPRLLRSRADPDAVGYAGQMLRAYGYGALVHLQRDGRAVEGE